jgi:hypothetical protein
LRFRSRSVVSVFVLAFAFVFLPRAAFASPGLPVIPGWTCGELRTTKFEAVSGDYGYWLERRYRTPDGISIAATLMFGSGPKFYNLPPAGVSADNEGSVSDYEIITIAGYRSAIEYDRALGYSVAVNAFDKKYTLTVECGWEHERGEVLRAVESLVKAIEENYD